MKNGKSSGWFQSGAGKHVRRFRCGMGEFRPAGVESLCEAETAAELGTMDVLKTANIPSVTAS